jgi:6-phosphogluconolactonase/glucosamine-6-phosphate isomerase/deaminase
MSNNKPEYFLGDEDLVPDSDPNSNENWAETDVTKEVAYNYDPQFGETFVEPGYDNAEGEVDG